MHADYILDKKEKTESQKILYYNKCMIICKIGTAKGSQISLNEILIAPCGMNCCVCMAYLREKNKCPGCRGTDVNKPITRVRCKLKTCEIL